MGKPISAQDSALSRGMKISSLLTYLFGLYFCGTPGVALGSFPTWRNLRRIGFWALKLKLWLGKPAETALNRSGYPYSCCDTHQICQAGLGTHGMVRTWLGLALSLSGASKSRLFGGSFMLICCGHLQSLVIYTF